MSLTEIEIQKIAHLAKLNIPKEKISSLTKDLDNILTLANQMSKVDTKNVKPISHPSEATQPLRPDQVTEINQRDLFQKIAPNTSAGLYIVPKVIETE